MSILKIRTSAIYAELGKQIEQDQQRHWNFSIRSTLEVITSFYEALEKAKIEISISSDHKFWLVYQSGARVPLKYLIERIDIACYQFAFRNMCPSISCESRLLQVNIIRKVVSIMKKSSLFTESEMRKILGNKTADELCQTTVNYYFSFFPNQFSSFSSLPTKYFQPLEYQAIQDKSTIFIQFSEETMNNLAELEKVPKREVLVTQLTTLPLLGIFPPGLLPLISRYII